jgi:predicted porin
MFPKGTWTVDLYASYNASVAKGESVSSGVAGVSYYFAERHAVRAEVVGHFLDNDGDSPDADDSWAPGANIGLRWHFHERDRLTLFIEGIAGLFYGQHNFPKGGTHFNFNEQFGLGATYRIDGNVHFLGGVRYMHISNARIRGADENPSYDGLGGYVGVLFNY